MALLDFLGQNVGGYAQGPMPSGAAGVPQGGMTYGDILGAAMQRGSKPGSSGAMFGPLIAGQYGTTQQQIGGQAQQNLLQGLPATGQQHQDSTGAILSLLL